MTITLIDIEKSMKLRFSKMHGLGNDFVVIDAIRQKITLDTAQLRHLADRRLGIGCDQILLVEAATGPEADFCYRIFNADGGEVEQCGNGARCFVRFVREQGLTTQKDIRVQTVGGLISLHQRDDGNISVNMGEPRFLAADIPFLGEDDALCADFEVGAARLQLSVLSMGNPHAVQVVADVDTAPVLTQGPLIEQHARFPKRVNAGFMQVCDPHHIRLRVYERGAGETLACGTGACAAVVAGIRRNLLVSPVQVTTRGGNLEIAWAGGGQPVWMTGPAATVFEGEIQL